MDRITFTVNGLKCSVGHEVDSDTSLNDYLRNHLNQRGTKYMCKEGGCGACVVAVTVEDPHRRTFSVNSCLVSITSCHGWEVTTIEGIGGRGKGYHPIQKTLAEYNGTQCGYCSPGFVMSMYSLLESKHYDVSQHEIENSFGSNTCRCTGSRPILEAFKSFATDAPKPPPKIEDIEDLHICVNKENCKKCDKTWCFLNKSELDDNKVKKIYLKDGRVWYRVIELRDIFNILDKEGYDSYMLVNGNTGRGAVQILVIPHILIDISQVTALKGYYFDQNLVFGAGTTLTELMELFKNVARDHEEFRYLLKLYEHLDLVAHIPVRNIGSVAGNLMVKHKKPEFSSDVFLLLETVMATLVIVNKDSSVEVTPEQFLSLDMKGRVIAQVKIPPLSHNYEFVSFKVMARAQNAHAQVNAAFLYEFDSHIGGLVKSARIVYGGIAGSFVHAKKTEKFLHMKKIFNNETLQQSLKILDGELKAEEIPGEMKPEYRKKCALGLFYKGLLALIPQQKLKPYYRSGARDLRKTRPLSKSMTVDDTNPIIWPVNEPMPKTDALIQCAGESKYVNDIPTQPNEVFCAFVTSDICRGEILSIDPEAALKIPGVLAFFSAKDIPGRNSFLSQKVLAQFTPEEIFAEKFIMFYDQPIGLIVAETEKLANRAALLVKVNYKVDKKKPILTINDARKRDTSRISLFTIFPARDRGVDVQNITKGCDNIFWQYHNTMETLSVVCRPSEIGLDVSAATQYLDSVHIGISEALNIPQNRINVTVPRCGGAYGIKITRTSLVAVACALATYLLDRPCRFVMSIQANLRVVGRRLPCTRDFEAGVNSRGEIQYLEYHIYEDHGYVASETVEPILLSAIKNCYDNRRWQYKIFIVLTDTAANVFARAPGSLEGITMTESIMEQISYELQLDPVEVRLNNLEQTNTIVREIAQKLLQDAEYSKRKEEIENFNKLNRWKKRGLRVAFMDFPIPLLVNFSVLMSVHHGDGTVNVIHGGVEIGQGIDTMVIQTVAYTLNISIDKVKCKASDVTTVPNSFTTGGSKTTESVCTGAIKCCQILLDRLSAIRETLDNPTWEALIEAAFTAGINLQTSYFMNSNDGSPYRSAGVALSEVELDILTGEHDVLRVDIIEDVGLSMNPELDIGQVEGAFVMGLGYFTHEEFIFDKESGELLTDRTWYYKVPLTKDIPIDFRVQLRRNSFNPIGTLGAKAVSEPPLCLAVSVAFALREAIASSRENTGYPRNKWFNVDGPFSLQNMVLAANAKLEEFLFY